MGCRNFWVANLSRVFMNLQLQRMTEWSLLFVATSVWRKVLTCGLIIVQISLNQGRIILLYALYTCNFALCNCGIRPAFRFHQFFIIMLLTRFRLRVNAGDYENEALFLMTDDMVRKVAPLTCKLLLDTVCAKKIICFIVFVMFFIPLTLLCIFF
jgi:hypothetical protein